MGELDVEKANRVANNIGRNVAERYPLSDPGELAQEVWGWIVSHADEVEGWEEEWWVRNLYRRGYRVAQSAARKERAHFLGYEPQDEFFYSVGLLRKILPLYFNEGLEVDSSFHNRIIKLDLDVAFECLDAETSTLLVEVFAGDQSVERTKALAGALEITEDAAVRKVDRLLGRIIDILGGPNPHPMVARQVLSNEQSIALTRRQG